MPIFLPCGGAPDIRYRVNIEGVGYDIRFRWNNRSESWFLYLGLSDQKPLFKTRLVGGVDLLEPYRGIEGVPQGILTVEDIVKTNGRPTLQGLGISNRFRILYATDENDYLRVLK